MNLLDKLADNINNIKETYTLEDALEEALANTTPTEAGVSRRGLMSKSIKIEINEIPYKGEFAEKK